MFGLLSCPVPFLCTDAGDGIRQQVPEETKTEEGKVRGLNSLSSERLPEDWLR